MKTTIACLIVLLYSSSADAQCTEANTATNPCHVTAGQALTASFEHDGLNTIDYRLWLDGEPIGQNIPVAALVNGVVTMPALTLSAGSHRLEVSASDGVDMVKSSPIYVDVTSTVPLPPSAPKNFKITIEGVLADGVLSGVTVTAVEVK